MNDENMSIICIVAVLSLGLNIHCIFFTGSARVEILLKQE